MGATVTCGKLVAGYKNQHGEVIYVLFEQKYEKNCYPHIPHWECIFIGPIEKALARLFCRASACEGGSLQNRSGYITPEGYLQGWIKAFTTVYQMNDLCIEADVGPYLSSAVPLGKKDEVKTEFLQFGKHAAHDQLERGETVRLSLFSDSDLIVKLLNGTLSPWRFIKSQDIPSTIADPGLSFIPEKSASVDAAIPAFYRVGEGRYVGLDEDGKWRFKDEAWMIVQNWVKSLASDPLKHIGNFKVQLKTLRQTLSDAPKVPEGGVVEVDRTVALEEDYQRRAIDSIEEEFQGVKTDKGFEFPAPTEARQLWQIASLPDGVSVWRIPTPASQQTGQITLL